MTEPGPASSQGLWANLRNRKVVQWGIAYAAVTWTLLEALQFLIGTFDWSLRIQQVATVAMLAGFPIAILLAWYHGDRGEQSVRRTEWALLTVFTLLGGSALWWFVGHVEHATRPAAIQGPASVVRSAQPALRMIAVLPFIDMSPGQDKDYFSDGLSEEVLDMLSRMSELRVVSRTSAFAFKGSKLASREIAEQLHVTHLLTGTVRRSGNRVRVSAELVDAQQDINLWSQSYDRTVDDVFKVQEEIAAAVARQLQVKLLGSHTPAAQRTDAGVYDDYLQARQLFLGRSEANLVRAETILQKVTAADGAYGPAWRLLGQVHAEQAYLGFGPVHVGYARARAALQKAIDLDADDAAAIAALALLEINYDWNLPEAARNLKRALQIAPQDESVLSASAQLLLITGHADRAIEVHRLQVYRDPLNGRVWGDLGYAFLCAGRFPEAIAAIQRSLEIEPNAVFRHQHIGLARLNMGDPHEALAEMKREPHETMRQLGLSFVYATAGRQPEARRILAGLERTQPYWAEMIAAGYAQLGDRDRAFRLIDLAQQERDPGGTELRSERLFQPIHDDPRWLRQLEEFGLSDAQIAALDFDVALPPLHEPQAR